MDTSVTPNESFYQYATGGWQAKNPLKPEYSSYNMFNVLNDNNENPHQRALHPDDQGEPCEGHGQSENAPTSTSWASTRYA